MTNLIELAERVQRENAGLVPYLLGWAGLGEPQPWGAAMGFALEVAHGYGLIVGELDATLTEAGQAVAAQAVDASLRARAEMEKGS